MMASGKLGAFADSRGEGLHSKLRELVERAAALPFSEVEIRSDGMLQAGPAPRSEQMTSSRNVILLPQQRREFRGQRK